MWKNVPGDGELTSATIPLYGLFPRNVLMNYFIQFMFYLYILYYFRNRNHKTQQF